MGGPDFMFTVFPSVFMFIFFSIFVIVIGGFIFTLVKGVGRWNYNNNQPRLSVTAYVVSKRTDVSHHHNVNNDQHFDSTSTYYYVTFEVESGDRMELQLRGNEFGLLAEGDQGQLTFQGTRYLGFERSRG